MSDSLPPRRFQLSLRTLLVLTALVSAVLALAYGRTTGPRDLPAGRYHVVLDKHGNPMMVDTATGQSWVRFDGVGGWEKLPVPRGVPADKSTSGR